MNGQDMFRGCCLGGFLIIFSYLSAKAIMKETAICSRDGLKEVTQRLPFLCVIRLRKDTFTRLTTLKYLMSIGAQCIKNVLDSRQQRPKMAALITTSTLVCLAFVNTYIRMRKRSFMHLPLHLQKLEAVK